MAQKCQKGSHLISHHVLYWFIKASLKKCTHFIVANSFRLMKMRIFLFLFRRCRSKQKERWVYVVVSRERASNTILENHCKKVKPWGQINDPSLRVKALLFRFSKQLPPLLFGPWMDFLSWHAALQRHSTLACTLHSEWQRNQHIARCGACPGQRQVSTTDANLHWVFVKNTLVSLIRTLSRHCLSNPPLNYASLFVSKTDRSRSLL